MSITSILVIFICFMIVASNITIYIYKKAKKIPTGECASCANKGNNLIKEYRKKYPLK